MQVSYGFRDLYEPACLTSPLLARVLPTALISWYGTIEGQWFRNQVASGLPKEVAAMTPEARWQWVRSEPAHVGMFSRMAQSTKYLAPNNGRVIFGTDSPCAPLYTNPPGSMVEGDSQPSRGGPDSRPDLPRRYARQRGSDSPES
jgi:hypothetical protein